MDFLVCTLTDDQSKLRNFFLQYFILEPYVAFEHYNKESICENRH